MAVQGDGPAAAMRQALHPHHLLSNTIPSGAIIWVFFILTVDFREALPCYFASLSEARVGWPLTFLARMFGRFALHGHPKLRTLPYIWL